MSFLSKSGIGGVGSNLLPNSAWDAARRFFVGSPETRDNVSTLRSEQEPLLRQGINAGLRPGAGGAFGDSADYYRNLLSDNPADLDAYAAPELRRFNEQTIPGLAEQFAGMGSGGLESSGFRNAAVNAGTDLSERIAAIRASLRQQGAQGLAGIGQLGLGNYSQNMVTQPGSEGFLSQIAPAVGTAIGSYIGGPAGGAAGNSLGQGASNWISNLTGNKRNNTSPYGNQQYQRSPLPNFMGR